MKGSSPTCVSYSGDPSIVRPGIATPATHGWHLCGTRCRRTGCVPYASLPAGERRCEPGLPQCSRCESAVPHPLQFLAARALRSTSTMNGASRIVSHFLRCRTENAGDKRRHAVPLLSLGVELTAASRGQPIELGLTIVVGFAPLTGNQALVFQSVERWVQRSLLDLQLLIGDLLYAKQNPVAMQRAERDGFEDQHVQGTVQQIDLFPHDLSLDV